MFSGMIKDRDYQNLSEYSRTRFDKIIDAVQRMSTSLTDLLNFTSLTKEEQFSMVNLNEILASILNDLELLIEQNSAVVHSDELPSIKAIPLQMQQLFYNIVNNALKFSTAGIPPVIHIKVQKIYGSEIKKELSLHAGQQYYEIIVKDNGIGFEEKHAERIFTMFQRLHDKKTFSGTGIGLALCKKVSLNHGGDIYAKSNPGDGASFHIFLPV
jgi:signal transduction histidine kinase